MHTLIKLSALLLLAGSVQLFGGVQVWAARADIDAAVAAKAAAAREARSSHPFTPSRGARATGTFITFDVPGAGTGLKQGTFPTGVNPEGDVTGIYLDASYVAHSFLRGSNGAVTTFDVPGGTSANFVFRSDNIDLATWPGISPPRSVAGPYSYLTDPNSVVHGFVRSGDGSFATFDAPGAGTQFFQGTFPASINPAGAVTGNYQDANYVSHGFLRYRDGTIATFDAPGVCTTTCSFLRGTQPVAINPEGTILGIYQDASNDNHGFLWTGDGKFVSFDPPGAIDANGVFSPVSSYSFGPDLHMSPSGVVTGIYFEVIAGNAFGGNYRTFIRDTDGTFTTFDAVPYPNGNPSLNIPCCTWTFPSGITPDGIITGSFNDGFGVNHGFLRTRDGTVTTFDAPGAGTNIGQGTAPVAITPDGSIIGLYVDPNYVYHGFLFRSAALMLGWR